MFILRRFTSEGFESNSVIGESYNPVYKETNLDEFNRTQELMKFSEIDQIFCFMVYKNGSEILPLYKKSNYYMMTESGKTFANLTFR